jgi:hypothetical protein
MDNLRERRSVYIEWFALWRQLVFADAATADVGEVSRGNAIRLTAGGAGAERGKTHWSLRGEGDLAERRRFD